MHRHRWGRPPRPTSPPRLPPSPPLLQSRLLPPPPSTHLPWTDYSSAMDGLLDHRPQRHVGRDLLTCRVRAAVSSDAAPAAAHIATHSPRPPSPEVQRDRLRTSRRRRAPLRRRPLHRHEAAHLARRHRRAVFDHAVSQARPPARRHIDLLRRLRQRRARARRALCRRACPRRRRRVLTASSPPSLPLPAVQRDRPPHYRRRRAPPRRVRRARRRRRVPPRLPGDVHLPPPGPRPRASRITLRRWCRSGCRSSMASTCCISSSKFLTPDAPNSTHGR